MVNRLLPILMKKVLQIYRRLGGTLPEHRNQLFRAPGSVIKSGRFDTSAPSPAPKAVFSQAPRTEVKWDPSQRLSALCAPASSKEIVDD